MESDKDRRKPGDRPYCYGILNNVFPMGQDGLRHTPESCRPCIYKTECLRFAVKQPEGAAVKEEALDRAYEAGAVGFFARWSRKKALDRQKKHSA